MCNAVGDCDWRLTVLQIDDMSTENDNSHNIIDSNEDDGDDDGEAADMEEFEESGMLEMVDPVGLLCLRLA